ncbi:MAG: hypothetical protein ABI790_06605 [Betaproteobacteria bacterium]
MYIVDNHFPSRKSPPHQLSIVPSAQEFLEVDSHRDEGRYRSAQDYPIGVFSYLDYAEVEKSAHDAANYDAAEALDSN